MTAAERCVQYRQQVRREAERTLGFDYPWWYNLGQLEQESRCRPDITAFDGGQGLAQFMPTTRAAISKELGEQLDAYNPAHAIRLQAVFLSDLRKSCPVPKLWATYQAYNGGCKLLKIEAGRAGGWDHDRMRAACIRKVLTLANGKKLDLCEVNYFYSRLVAKYGDQYREGPDAIPFW